MSALTTSVAELVTMQSPSTLQSAVELATAAYNLKKGSPLSLSSSSASSSTAVFPTSTPDPMDLDSIVAALSDPAVLNALRGARPAFSPARKYSREDCMRLGLCFKCFAKGHRSGSDECPLKDK